MGKIGLLLVFSTLLVFSSCSQRYAHIKKVRVNASGQKPVTRHKIKANTLLHIKITERLAATGANTFLIYEIPAAKELNEKTAICPAPEKLGREDSITSGTKITKIYPTANEIKPGQRNFADVMLTSLILLLVGVGIILAAGFVANMVLYVLAVIDNPLIIYYSLRFAVAMVTLSSIAGAALVGGILLKSYHSKRPLTIGGNTYIFGEVKKFPKWARAKRALHNFLLSAIITAIAAFVVFSVINPLSLLPWMAFTSYLWPFFIAPAYHFLKLWFVILFARNKDSTEAGS